MNRSGEYARALLEKARGDLYVLERLAGDAAAPPWSVGFHAQQAAEKALKAVLASKSIEFPRTHNLAVLLDLLRDAAMPLPPDGQDLPRLTPFGAAMRYDAESEGDADKSLDRTWTVQAAQQTVAWAEEILKAL